LTLQKSFTTKSSNRRLQHRNGLVVAEVATLAKTPYFRLQPLLLALLIQHYMAQQY
jgi:hypothetical protein